MRWWHCERAAAEAGTPGDVQVEPDALKEPEAIVAWTHAPTLLALAAALVVRPLAYTIIDPASMLGSLDGSHGRRPWWLFHLWILLFQWIPFFVAWWALKRGSRPWSAYGIDWSWFRWRRTPLLGVTAVLVGCAFIAPRYWYGSELPRVSETFPLLPVTSLERIFFLVSSVSAGICEEVCYRGLPLRGTTGSLSGALALLPVTVVSFVFVHGWFGLEHFGIYGSIGLIFGAVFLLLRRRHLEWLVVTHALIDAAYATAP